MRSSGTIEGSVDTADVGAHGDRRSAAPTAASRLLEEDPSEKHAAHGPAGLGIQLFQ